MNEDMEMLVEENAYLKELLYRVLGLLFDMRRRAPHSYSPLQHRELLREIFDVLHPDPDDEEE